MVPAEACRRRDRCRRDGIRGTRGPASRSEKRSRGGRRSRSSGRAGSKSASRPSSWSRSSGVKPPGWSARSGATASFSNGPRISRRSSRAPISPSQARPGRLVAATRRLVQPRAVTDVGERVGDKEVGTMKKLIDRASPGRGAAISTARRFLVRLSPSVVGVVAALWLGRVQVRHMARVPS